MDRKAIVFGADQPVGAAVVRALLERDVATDVARSWSASPPSNLLELGGRDVVASIADDNLLEALIGRNWVFLSAIPGENEGPQKMMQVAVPALRRLVSAGREAGIDRIILSLPASIAWEPGTERIDESHRYLPGTAADELLEAFYSLAQEATYAAADGVDVVVVASALVVGPGVLPIRVSVPRDHREIDIVHVDEVARMHVEAATKAGWGTTYLLGGHSIARNDLSTWLAAPRSTGFLGRGGQDSRRHLVDPGMSINPARAVRELGFEPHFGL